MPWGRLDDSFYDHPKLERIPVAQRLACAGLWARAISWCNRFLTDGHIPRGRVERLDGTPELASALVASGLWEETATGYEIHDFLEFNDSRADVTDRREKETARQREWRKKKAASRNGVSHDVTANGSGPDVTPLVTASVTPLVTGIPARATRDAWRSANPGPARPGPADESLEREDSDARPSGRRQRRADVQALVDRGWKRVTKDQRRILDEILARHDVTGPEFAAAAIRATPPDRDPLDAVMTADRLWQDAQRRQADADEERAKAARAEEAVPWLR